METFLALCVGLALSAACGLRVFLPLLAMAIGSRAGLIELGEGFQWLGSWPAVWGFASAALVEVVAYFWPWLDHALDAIATPSAVIAGTIVTASQVHHMDPTLTWALGLIAGGGVAGATQAATVTTRGASTIVTGGVLNPVINGVQSVVSGVLSVLAVVVPVLGALAALILASLLVGAVVAVVRRRRGRGLTAA